MATFAELFFFPRGAMRTGHPTKLPVIITSKEDYAVAIERLKELEFRIGYRQDDIELVAITEAMLKYEMHKAHTSISIDR